MNFNKIYLLLILIFFLCAHLAIGQTKRALVIGIGKYEDPDWRKINGDRDVQLMSEVLEKADFKQIRVLRNREATKAAIVAEFRRLIKKCQRGDEVYIHFSGHGQQITDLDGDEEDGWDECWIPYDAYRKRSDRYNGEQHLTDDEINGLLTELNHKVGRDGKILVAVDACHSGDSSRGSKETIRGTYDKFTLPGATTQPTATYQIEDWIILSACKDYQRNTEIMTSKGKFGKLTYAIYELVKNKKTYTNQMFYDELSLFFDRHRSNLQQTPLMEGNCAHFEIISLFQQR